jgi:hypothetical protein
LYDLTNAANIAPTTVYTSTGISGTSYGKVEETFTIPTGCVNARIYFRPGSTTSDVAYFDDVEIYRVDDLSYSDWTEHWAIGNLDGLYGFSVDTYGVGLGSTDGEYLTLTPGGGLQFYSNVGDEVAKLSGEQFRIGRNVISGDAWVAAAPTTGLRVRYMDPVGSKRTLFEADTGGDVTLGWVALDQGNVHWNFTNKRLEFRGGTGGTVVEAYIDTDGSITAGGGNVLLNSDGVAIKVNTTSSFDQTKALSFLDGATVLAFVDNKKIGTPTFWNNVTFGANPVTSYETKLNLLSKGNGTNGARIQLYATDGSATDDAYLELGNDASALGSGPTMLLYGTAAGAATFEITGKQIIDQLTADDEILALRSSGGDVQHSFTNVTDQETYGLFKKTSASAGGLRIDGFGETNVGLALWGNAEAPSTGKGTGSTGIIEMRSFTDDGSTGRQAPATNENLVVMRSGSTTRFIFDADGDAHADVQWTTFDKYDDAQMARTLAVAKQGPGFIRSEFDDWLKYNDSDLVTAGILSPEGMLNTTRLLMLHNGAVTQLWARIVELEQRIKRMS